MAGYVLPPAVGDTEPETDPRAMLTAELLRDAIWQASATSPRSQQKSIGASQIGGECQRQIAYRLLEVPAVNISDPMRALAGIGLHAALADLFARIDGGSGRYLIEHRCEYRNVPGTVDLFDRRRHQVIDWKSSLKARLRDIKANGPPPKYRVQLQVYGAALAAAGEAVETVAVVYVPLDAPLSELRAFVYTYDQQVADQAIDRLAALVRKKGPAQIAPTPTRLCPWCSHYRAGSTDLAKCCPGNS